MLSEIDKSQFISLNNDSFEPELADLMARIEESENYTIAPKMLRQAASLITQRARQELTVSDDFVCFAIDWENEGHNLAKILNECGASPEIIKSWKKKGWV